MNKNKNQQKKTKTNSRREFTNKTSWKEKENTILEHQSIWSLNQNRGWYLVLEIGKKNNILIRVQYFLVLHSGLNMTAARYINDLIFDCAKLRLSSSCDIYSVFFFSFCVVVCGLLFVFLLSFFGTQSVFIGTLVFSLIYCVMRILWS